MSNLIVKDNALIEASHKLNEAEQRLLLLAILQARKYCDDIEELKGKELIINAIDYINFFNVDKTTAYRVLKKAAIGLFRAEWGYKFINNKGQIQIAYRRFIQSADYINNGAIVKLKFADDTIPMLVELEKRFTVYEIEQMSKLSSSYAMRMYEFFMQHFNKKTGRGWLDISLDELRFRLGLLPGQYDKMGNFKRRVLDFSVQQINENTYLSCDYTQKKCGKIIVGFKFNFERKFQEIENSEKNIKQIDVFSPFTDEERKIIQTRIAEYIQKLENQGKVVDTFHRQNIVKKAISEKWGVDSLAEIQNNRELDNYKQILMEKWRSFPSGTRFRHQDDKSEWIKENDYLAKFGNGKRSVVPEYQMLPLLQLLIPIENS